MSHRRTLSALAVAGLLATVPIASAGAADYPAPEFTTSVSDSTPSVGTPFTVTATGPVDNDELTMTITCPALTDDQIEIAGTKSMTKPTANGAASFQVALAAECSCEVVVYDAAGNVVSRQKIATQGFDATAPGAAADGTGASASGSGALPKTGVSGIELTGLVGAVALGGAGVVGLVAARRRRLVRA